MVEPCPQSWRSHGPQALAYDWGRDHRNDRRCEVARRVVAFFSSNQIDPDLAAEIFVLDRPMGDAARAE